MLIDIEYAAEAIWLYYFLHLWKLSLTISEKKMLFLFNIASFVFLIFLCFSFQQITPQIYKLFRCLLLFVLWLVKCFTNTITLRKKRKNREKSTAASKIHFDRRMSVIRNFGRYVRIFRIIQFMTFLLGVKWFS